MREERRGDLLDAHRRAPLSRGGMIRPGGDPDPVHPVVARFEGVDPDLVVEKVGGADRQGRRIVRDHHEVGDRIGVPLHLLAVEDSGGELGEEGLDDLAAEAFVRRAGTDAPAGLPPEDVQPDLPEDVPEGEGARALPVDVVEGEEEAPDERFAAADIEAEAPPGEAETLRRAVGRERRRAGGVERAPKARPEAAPKAEVPAAGEPLVEEEAPVRRAEAVVRDDDDVRARRGGGEEVGEGAVGLLVEGLDGVRAVRRPVAGVRGVGEVPEVVADAVDLEEVDREEVPRGRAEDEPGGLDLLPEHREVVAVDGGLVRAGEDLPPVEAVRAAEVPLDPVEPRGRMDEVPGAIGGHEAGEHYPVLEAVGRVRDREAEDRRPSAGAVHRLPEGRPPARPRGGGPPPVRPGLGDREVDDAVHGRREPGVEAGPGGGGHRRRRGDENAMVPVGHEPRERRKAPRRGEGVDHVEGGAVEADEDRGLHRRGFYIGAAISWVPVTPESLRRRVAWTAAVVAALAYRDVRVRYKRAALGLAWSLGVPLLLAAVYTWLIQGLFKAGVDRYAFFALSAIFPWRFLAAATSSSTQSYVWSAGVITRLPVPPAVFPLAAVGVEAYHFAVSLGLLLLLAPLWGAAPGLHWLALLPAFLVAAAVAAGIGMVLAPLQARFRDVKYAVNLALTVAFFAAPIVYPAEMVPERYRLLVLWNPIAIVVRPFREILLGAAAPGPSFWAAGLSYAVAFLLLGAWATSRLGRSAADHV